MKPEVSVPRPQRRVNKDRPCATGGCTGIPDFGSQFCHYCRTSNGLIRPDRRQEPQRRPRHN